MQLLTHVFAYTRQLPPTHCFSRNILLPDCCCGSWTASMWPRGKGPSKNQLGMRLPPTQATSLLHLICTLVMQVHSLKPLWYQFKLQRTRWATALWARLSIILVPDKKGCWIWCGFIENIHEWMIVSYCSCYQEIQICTFGRKLNSCMCSPLWQDADVSTEHPMPSAAGYSKRHWNWKINFRSLLRTMFPKT